MLINATAVLFALLCVYWFAFKEGFFSGVIHLACVVVAGALTFAFCVDAYLLATFQRRVWANK